jgi:SAM-dependent methyltransferase
VAARSPARVLELAAGTGVVTRRLAQTLPESTSIVASDLNPAMLAQAAQSGTSRAIEWTQADALALPFADEEFDVVVCQFGVMFFPDKAKGYAEARRVLRAGGALLFNVWDRLDQNEFAATVNEALESFFPDSPPNFMARVPHGYYDRSVVAEDLRRGGFQQAPAFHTLTAQSRAASAKDVAIALCQGTPVRNEIEARAASRLDAATEAARKALAARFGSGEVEAKMQAHVITVERG